MSKLVSTKGKPTIKVLETCLPKILIKSQALIKMQLFIENCADEIGWLGTAYKQEGYVIIDDMYLFDQEVHSTTTEITPEGLSNFAEELLLQEDGIEIWNNMKVWGHSHVNMSVSPSGQDDSQMDTFSESGHDWFIRIIANKKGELKLDLFDYEAGISYIDLAWKELASNESLEIMKQIEMLQQLLSLQSKKQVESLEPTIVLEIDAKVKKKFTAYSYPTYQKATPAIVAPKETSNLTKSSTTSTTPTKIVTYKDGWGDMLGKSSDIYQYLSQEDIISLGECRSYYEARQYVDTMGYGDFFTYKDVNFMWEECKKKILKVVD
jgi:hypothetical protein